MQTIQRPAARRSSASRERLYEVLVPPTSRAPSKKADLGTWEPPHARALRVVCLERLRASKGEVRCLYMLSGIASGCGLPANAPVIRTRFEEALGRQVSEHQRDGSATLQAQIHRRQALLAPHRSAGSPGACVTDCSCPQEEPRSLGSAESLKPLMCLSLSRVPMGKFRRENNCRARLLNAASADALAYKSRSRGQQSRHGLVRIRWARTSEAPRG